MKIDYLKLICSILISEAAGVVGSVFVASSLTGWYLTINKPSFTPPGYLIGIVWTAMFFLMGIALYIIWNSIGKGKEKRKMKSAAIAIFGIQLLLNILWSFFFFYLRSPLYGLIEIVILWIAVLATIISFYRISRSAAALLIPYILWVSFAAFLTYSVFLLNP